MKKGKIFCIMAIAAMLSGVVPAGKAGRVDIFADEINEQTELSQSKYIFEYLGGELDKEYDGEPVMVDLYQDIEVSINKEALDLQRDIDYEISDNELPIELEDFYGEETIDIMELYTGGAVKILFCDEEGQAVDATVSEDGKAYAQVSDGRYRFVLQSQSVNSDDVYVDALMIEFEVTKQPEHEEHTFGDWMESEDDTTKEYRICDECGYVETRDKQAKLSITGKVNLPTVVIGSKVVVSAEATGGSGDYTYSFLVRNRKTNEWYRFSGFQQKDTLTWTAGTAGTREFYAEAKDSSGNVVRSSAIVVNVTDENELSITAGATLSYVASGSQVVISAAAKGGDGKYTYSFLVRNKKTNSWYRFSDFKSADSLIWTATTEGVREFYVEVKDGTGKVVRSSAVLVEVSKAKAATDALSINAGASTSSAKQGSKVIINAQAQGGTGEYTYSFLVRNKKTNSWYRFSGFKSTNVLTWTATDDGIREFYVEVKDGNGDVVRSSAVVVTVK